MKRSLLTYTIGIVLLAVFLAGDILPATVRLSQPFDHELVTQSEEENSGKGAENKTGFERSEYWIDHNAEYMLPAVPVLTGIKIIPGDVYTLQKGFYSISTPPPDAGTI